MPSQPLHVLRTPHPVKHVMWRPSASVNALSSTSQHHLTELLVVPRTVGVSPFGVRGSAPKEPEHNKDVARDDLADLDKDRPGIWDVRRHHVPKYVLLGGEGAVAGSFMNA